MFGYTTLKSVVGKDVALSEQMIDAINEWKNMLNGQADWISAPVESLRIEKGICREFADAVLVELETNISNERLNKMYQKCLTKLNENLQSGLGLGSFILKPLGNDRAEFVAADKFIPISFDDDKKPNDVGFLTIKRAGENNYFIRFERHYFVNGNLTIETKCFHSQSANDIGIPCKLSAVPEWEHIDPGPITYLGMTTMDFGYYRNPIENEIDESSCGVSIFDAAKGRICKADFQAARLDWEFDSGERAIHVDDRALKQAGTGKKIAKLNSRLYRGLNIEDKDKDLFKEYSPEMRDEAFKRGLEEYKREIEFIVGLAYGDLSNVNEVQKTAEEIKTSKARKYNRVTAIQNNLRNCLEDFARGLAFYNSMLNSGYEFICDFSDSILTDEKTDRQLMMDEIAAGIRAPWEYRVRFMGEDEETAKKNLPPQNTVLE